MREKSGWVYIMANRKRTLYVGVTSNLERRVAEHKIGHIQRIVLSRYQMDKLIYYERFGSIHAAIDREKKIKGWLRIKKIALIVFMNPE